MIRLLLAVLAVWRVTHLLAHEDGPADIIVRIRARLGHDLLGKLMDCFYCLSLWVAAPAALFVTLRPLDWLVTWLALSGGACLLERIGKGPVIIESIAPPEERADPHVLWSETLPDANQPASGDAASSTGPVTTDSAAAHGPGPVAAVRR